MQAHFFISGFVQGIGYRQFVKSNARKLGLNGWVRNLSDGRVEAIAQGDKEKIEELITLCKTGPMMAEIKEVEIKWEKVNTLFQEFKQTI